jgi:hypothetical protein
MTSIYPLLALRHLDLAICELRKALINIDLWLASVPTNQGVVGSIPASRTSITL